MNDEEVAQLMDNLSLLIEVNQALTVQVNRITRRVVAHTCMAMFGNSNMSADFHKYYSAWASRSSLYNFMNLGRQLVIPRCLGILLTDYHLRRALDISSFEFEQGEIECLSTVKRSYSLIEHSLGWLEPIWNSGTISPPPPQSLITYSELSLSVSQPKPSGPEKETCGHGSRLTKGKLPF